jgi:hypothetical protein
MLIPAPPPLDPEHTRALVGLLPPLQCDSSVNPRECHHAGACTCALIAMDHF